MNQWRITMTREDWERSVVKQHLETIYDDKETIDKYTNYIVEQQLPINLWLDVDTCDNEDCGKVDHEFHSTEGMVDGGIGVICNSCFTIDRYSRSNNFRLETPS